MKGRSAARALDLLAAIFFGLLAVYFWQTGGVAFASRLGVVENDETEVYENPKRGSVVVARLKKNTQVLASNYPTENFHKVRTKDNIKGWVLADTLVLQPIPEGAPERTMADDEGISRTRSKKNANPKFRLKALGDFNFYNASGIITNFNGLNLGYEFGLEIHYILNSSFSLALRGEYIFNSVNLTDSVSGNVFLIGTSAMPLQIGLVNTIADEDVFSIFLGVFGGYSPVTQVSSTLVSSTSASAVSAATLTGLAKLEVDIRFYKRWALFLEGGYRFLQTGVLVPPTTGSGVSVFTSTFSINYNGPFFGGGLGVAF